MNTWTQANWLSVLAIIMVLAPVGAAIAGSTIPYFAYYQLMSWVVAGAAALIAWRACKQDKRWLSWLMVLVAVVFNPLAPLYLRADVWQIVDIVAAVIFIATFFVARPRSN